jgi:hypothetical protein
LNAAIKASPTWLTTTPPCSSTMPVAALKKLFSSPMTSAGAKDSERRVNPSMSAKITLASRVCSASWPESMSCSATCAGT